MSHEKDTTVVPALHLTLSFVEDLDGRAAPPLRYRFLTPNLDDDLGEVPKDSGHNVDRGLVISLERPLTPLLASYTYASSPLRLLRPSIRRPGRARWYTRVQFIQPRV